MPDKKLKELVLYIAEKSKDDPSFGLTKLNKILFSVDFNYYGWRGRSITGSKYVHRERGPAPHRMPIILESLQKEGRAEIELTEYFGYKQKRVIPLKGHDMSAFTEEELSYTNMIMESLQKFHGSHLSDISHKLKPWLVTIEGEEIPYHSIFNMYEYPPEQSGINWAKEELEKLRKKHSYAF